MPARAAAATLRRATTVALLVSGRCRGSVPGCLRGAAQPPPRTPERAQLANNY